jgi:hypothetical protein
MNMFATVLLAILAASKPVQSARASVRHFRVEDSEENGRFRYRHRRAVREFGRSLHQEDIQKYVL